MQHKYDSWQHTCITYSSETMENEKNIPSRGTLHFTEKHTPSHVRTEKRAYERMQSHTDVRFYDGRTFYPATALNISLHGMFLKTTCCVPVGSEIHVVMRSGNALLQIVSRVKRLNRTNGRIDGMGIEIISPSKSYQNIVNNPGEL